MSTMGHFVTFEGIEGVGKSTQLERLRLVLEGQGAEVVTTREPGGTPLAEAIRDLVLHEPGEPVPAAAELLLMMAARAVHTTNCIRPALGRGAWVLCDRYTDASYAYQGGGRGVADDDIAQLATLAQGGVEPELTLLLDVPVMLALERARTRHGRRDRIEAETAGFFERVRAKYLERARQEPGRIKVIDASGAVDAVAAIVARHVAALAKR
jgi:dTMP kinase